MANPLINTEMNNISSDYNLFSSNLNGAFGTYPSTEAEQQQYLNTVLSETTKKRACCLKKSGTVSSVTEYDGVTYNEPHIPVKVRLPIPDDISVRMDSEYTGSDKIETSDPTSEAYLWKKYGYWDKVVLVPESSCDGLMGDNFAKCDDFMFSYCTNMKELYLAQQNEVSGNKTYDHSEFIKIKPECACYGVKATLEGVQLEPKCVLEGCTQSKAYLDPMSRPVAEDTCSVNVCQANIIVEGEVGGNVNVQSAVKQDCNRGATGGTSSNTESDGTTSNNNTSNGDATTDGTNSDETSNEETSSNDTTSDSDGTNESSSNETEDNNIEGTEDDIKMYDSYDWEVFTLAFTSNGREKLKNGTPTIETYNSWMAYTILITIVLCLIGVFLFYLIIGWLFGKGKDKYNSWQESRNLSSGEEVSL